MKIAIIIIVGLVCIGTIYMLNDEKLYSEYWLQRQIDKLASVGGNEKKGDSQETLLYKFYFDSSIDIAVELDREGNMALMRHSWFESNNTKRKTYNFTVDKNEFKTLKDDFKTRWKKSNVQDADDKFGGIYYEIQMTDAACPEQSISVGFYNVTPDKSFTDFKNKIIQLAKSELKK